MQEYTQNNVLTLVRFIHEKKEQDRVLLSLHTSALIVRMINGVVSKHLGEFSIGKEAFIELKKSHLC